MQPTVREEKMTANIGVKFSLLHAASTCGWLHSVTKREMVSGLLQWLPVQIHIIGLPSLWSPVSLVPRKSKNTTLIQRDGSVQCPYIKANARTSIKKIVKYSRRNRTINVAADCRKASSLHSATAVYISLTAQNSHKNHTTWKGKFIITAARKKI